jgi:linearmycin/streptolysin S transport system permease protein
MGAARLIAGKDLKLRLRDRSAIVVGVIAPLGLAFIFNMILGGVAEEGFVPVFAVADLDGGSVATGFTDVLDQLDQDGTVEIAERPAVKDEAVQLAEDGTVGAAFIIPAGFSTAVTSQQVATMEIVGNPDNPTTTEIARSIAQSFAAEVSTSQLAVATAVATASPAVVPSDIGRLAQAASEGIPQAVVVGGVETEKRELDLATFFAASMSVFFLFFTVSFGVNGLLEEQQQGTIRRLLAAPIRASTIVSGKALVSFALGIVSMTILVVMSSLLLGARWGNPVGVAILIICGVVAATGMMMVVAAFAKTPEQAGNLQAILAVGLGMLGGIFFPGALGTGVLSVIAYVSPHRWFLVGLTDLAGGDDLLVIFPSVLGLLGFAGVSWALAMTKFRTRGLAI